MNTTQAQQKAFDDALVAPADRLEFEKCNMRLKTNIKPKEATFQFAVHKSSIRFMINKKKVSLDVDMFQEILQHSGDINYPTDVNVGYLHQPWRAFATVINKCLSGKETWIGRRFRCLSSNPLEKVPDEQQQKNSSTDEGTTKPRVPDVPIYEYESEKESWGDSEDEDKDDENDSDDISDEGDNDNDGNNGNDSDDSDESDDERTESDRDEIPDPNKTNKEHNEEEEEYDDEFNIEEDENMDEEEDDEVTKELYKDVNVNLGNEDADMTDADQGGADQQNVSQQSGFEQEEEDDHVTLTLVLDTQKTGADNEIASLMDTSAYHATSIPEITSSSTTANPPPTLFFNPLSQQATPTPTPMASETTTLLPALLDFSYVFKFNERVFNLEKDLSEMKQVYQYAQALSPILVIVDRYMDNKLREAINKAIQAHNFYCREKAQAEKREYIEVIDLTKNVTESLEAAALTRSSSQPHSSYEAAATLSEFELTKILIDKMERNKSYDIVDHKRELYDALVKSYQIDKDLFDSYGEVFSLKRSQDDRDKDRDPSARSD
ncbi:hypothetical protein Tco_0912416 [Tanacetum coccineum]